jgi:radical SAM superfamily enzyme YgiQ (UPF0313 family)
VLGFPDAYTVGISHLGSGVLYHLLNDLPGVACDRTYCPRPDAEAVLREQDLPLFGWESRLALADFDLLAISVPYELCCSNVLTMLDLAGLPLRSADRDGRHPLVVIGDALADAPEPLAPFIDVAIPGDGEGPLRALVELLRDVGRPEAGAARRPAPCPRPSRQSAPDSPPGPEQAGGSPDVVALRAAREALLLRIAREVPSAYVPRFYESTTNPDGSPGRPRPARHDVPEQVRHAAIADLGDSPAITSPLVPLAEGVHERVAIEVMRGCPNACRFCQAGATRLPVRYRSVEEIVRIAREAIDRTGYDEISLLSLSTSDHPHLGELIARLTEEFADRRVGISLPSLRVDAQLEHLPKLTSTVRKGGLTIAAEAGSERLRRSIRKGITEEAMVAGVRSAYEAGWNKVKVYFIAGLPGETDDDLDEIVRLCLRLSDARREVDGKRGSINASVSWFVPKPHTPMQWSPMRSAEYFWHVRSVLRERTRRTPINMKFHFIEQSVLEGVIARGDRGVAEAIEAAWRAGARMDAWTEHFRWDLWQSALAGAGLDAADLAERGLDPELPTPWGHVRCHRGEEFLRREAGRLAIQDG